MFFLFKKSIEYSPILFECNEDIKKSGFRDAKESLIAQNLSPKIKNTCKQMEETREKLKLGDSPVAQAPFYCPPGNATEIEVSE